MPKAIKSWEKRCREHHYFNAILEVAHRKTSPMVGNGSCLIESYIAGLKKPVLVDRRYLPFAPPTNKPSTIKTTSLHILSLLKFAKQVIKPGLGAE